MAVALKLARPHYYRLSAYKRKLNDFYARTSDLRSALRLGCHGPRWVERGDDDASPRHNFAWAVWSGTPRVGDPWLRFAGKPERKPMQLALFEEGK
jgi:hypothetical protein